MISSEIWCAIISGGVTLAVSVGTWYVSVRKDKDKTREEIKTVVADLKNDITQVNAVVRQQTAIIDLKLQTLSTRVEKHNNVIERVFKLEQKVEDMEKKEA